MTLGALCAALACFAGLQTVLGMIQPTQPSITDLIRATTLSPVEWRLHRRGNESWYQRWVRPLALLWGGRLHLRPARIEPLYLIQAGLEPDQIDGVEFRVVRLMSAAAGAMLAGLLAILLSGAFLLVPLFAWAGYMTPARYLAGRRRRARMPCSGNYRNSLVSCAPSPSPGCRSNERSTSCPPPGNPRACCERKFNARWAATGWG